MPSARRRAAAGRAAANPARMALPEQRDRLVHKESRVRQVAQDLLEILDRPGRLEVKDRLEQLGYRDWRVQLGRQGRRAVRDRLVRLAQQGRREKMVRLGRQVRQVRQALQDLRAYLVQPDQREAAEQEAENLVPQDLQGQPARKAK